MRRVKFFVPLLLVELLRSFFRWLLFRLTSLSFILWVGRPAGTIRSKLSVTSYIGEGKERSHGPRPCHELDSNQHFLGIKENPSELPIIIVTFVDPLPHAARVAGVGSVKRPTRFTYTSPTTRKSYSYYEDFDQP